MFRPRTVERGKPRLFPKFVYPALVLFVFAIGGFGAPAGGVVGGPQFQVSGTGVTPSVASDADGNFVIVWRDYDAGFDYSIRGRRFDAEGVPRGDAFQVSSPFEYFYNYPQRYGYGGPSVASDADGDFVVVWRGEYQVGPPPGFLIQGRRFAADGTPGGPQFQVSSITADFAYESTPSVVADTDGDFIVVWRGYQNGLGLEIQGRDFAADGTPGGPQFQVSDLNADDYSSVPAPSVAADAYGNFVVAWRDYVYQGYGLRNGYQIQARRFAADGTPSGAPFQVGSIATGYAYESGPSVAADAYGDFVVVWRDYFYRGPGEHNGIQIQARGFAASGTPAGPQFGVGKETSGYVYELDPSVAVDVDGDFVVVWRDYGYPSTLQERTFAADGTPARRQCRVDIDTGARYQDAIAPSVASDADGDFVVVWRNYEYDYAYGYSSSIQARFGTRAAATECRDQLFFAEDLVAADNACAQAVADDSSDGEARFFRAATRIMRIVGEDVDGPDGTRFTDSVKEMMDQFGISSTGRDVFAFAPEIPENLADDVVLPPDSPGGSDVKELQSDVLLPAITASVEDLRAIAADTEIRLSPCELGVLGNFTGVEIDLGDVELFEAMLLLGKSEIFLAEAFDANVDLDSYTPLPEIIRIQTDWIDDNPQALELLPTGAASLTQANDANREAIASYLAGSAFIRSESDAQDDDFFTIEPDKLADEADLRMHIASLRSSLDGQTRVLNEGTTFIDEAAVIAELNQTLGTAFDSQGANLDLSLFYDDGPFSLREVIPPVAFDEAENRNFIADGSFPDPTFRGVLLPVPEPSQLWQLMSGLAGLGCLYRLRRRA